MVIIISTKQGSTILNNVISIDYKVSGNVIIEYMADELKTFHVKSSYVDLLSITAIADDGTELYKIIHSKG